jgi:thioredoxin 1
VAAAQKRLRTQPTVETTCCIDGVEATVTESLNKADFLKKVFNFEQNRQWRFEGQRPCIVDFHADWCQPCKLLSPILDELSEEYKGEVDFYRLDTATDPQVAAIFGIRSIPTMLFVPKQGNPRMTVGVVPKATIRQAIREILGVEPPGAGWA